MRQLRVVFDTNAIFNGSPSSLVTRAVSDLILKHRARPDLKVQWLLPEIVVLERQHQMQKRGVDLLGNVAAFYQLLDLPEKRYDQSFVHERVEARIREHLSRLDLEVIKIDPAAVDFDRLLKDAAFRRPPFDPAKEKGFRDALVLEAFMQVVANSPSDASECLNALVTGDTLLKAAATDRTKGLGNVRILDDPVGVEDLLNILDSDVGEEFISKLREDATRAFFDPANPSAGLFATARLRARISKEHAQVLRLKPDGSYRRENKSTWQIHPPKFEHKDAQQVTWTSLVDVPSAAYQYSADTKLTDPVASSVGEESPWIKGLYAVSLMLAAAATYQDPAAHDSYLKSLGLERLQTHSGKDSFAVRWTVMVTPEGLQEPTVEKIEHLGATWIPVATPS